MGRSASQSKGRRALLIVSAIKTPLTSVQNIEAKSLAAVDVYNYRPRDPAKTSYYYSWTRLEPL
jgi:hypothetical protein